ncbi:hypothetical protein GGR55DRAFT_625681 [Xylaria sp. FL0064]|nr:hypothetical protein GGR55DRAFT_625681 [Xylaria sp. FL0064]
MQLSNGKDGVCCCLSFIYSWRIHALQLFRRPIPFFFSYDSPCKYSAATVRIVVCTGAICFSSIASLKMGISNAVMSARLRNARPEQTGERRRSGSRLDIISPGRSVIGIVILVAVVNSYYHSHPLFSSGMHHIKAEELPQAKRRPSVG